MYRSSPLLSSLVVRKVLCGLLMAAFFVQPISVMAEESEATTTDDGVESAPLDEGSGMSSMMGSGGGDAGSEGRGLSSSKSYSSDQALISPFDGSLSLSYPLSLPPGRNGMQPDISLHYNSALTEHDWFGYGWSTNIPSIRRLNKNGSEKLYVGTSSTYYSSLSGELTQVGSTTEYRTRIETGDFLKFVFSGNVWVVTDKQGTRYTFGSTTASRQDNASSTSDVYQWLITEMRDTNDNYIKYTYFKEAGQIYPDTITYTGSGVTDGIFTVQYTRESRSDVTRSYATKFPVDNKYRIDKIRVSVNGSGVREYDLSYANGNNGTRSILSSITEYGVEGASTTTLPATNFSYSTSTNIWNEAASSSIPEPFVSSDGSFAGTYLVDVNGDSLQDVIRSYASSSSSVQKVYINKGGYWNYDASWSIPVIFHTSTTSRGVELVDVNGDSVTDIVQSNKEFGIEAKNVWLGTGSGWTLDASWSIPELFYIGNEDYGVRFADANGDGLADILAKRTNTASTTMIDRVYLNTGSGWVHDPAWSNPEAFIISSTTDSGARLVDLNGDGLTDVVIQRTDTFNVPVVNKAYINNGSGWVEDASWQIPLAILANHTIENGVRFVDVNADGLADIARMRADECGGQNSTVYLNTGSGWVLHSGWFITAPTVINAGEDSGARFTDLDGDGVVDIVMRTEVLYTGGLECSGTFMNQRNAIYMGADETADLVKQTIDKMGGTIDFTYQGSSRYKTSAGQFTNPSLPVGFQTIATTTYNSNFGNSWSETYVYSDGRMYFATSSPRDRKFAGFGKIDRIRNGSKVTSYQHQGNGNDSASSESSDGYSKIGFTYRVDTTNQSGTAYRMVWTNWATTSLGTSSEFIRTASEVSLDYDGNSDHKDSAVSYTYNDTYGNLSTRTEWGEVSANTDGTFSDTGADKRTTSYAYATNTSAYIVGLPQSERLDNNAGAKVRESRFYYDSAVLGSTTKGNLTKRDDWATTTTYVSTQWAYNSYGLKTSEVDPRGNTTTLVYDTHNLYPATTTNALSQSSTYTYDYSSGLVKTTTDSNGHTHEQVYDPLDRVTEIKEPRGTSDALVTVETNSYTDTKNALRVFTTKYLDSGTTTETYAYADGFGRPVQVRQEDETSNQFIVRDTVYGTDGMLLKESLPYFSNGSSRTSPSSVSALYTSYVYDPLDRRTAVATVLGTTQIGYDQWLETATDTLSHSKSYGYDAFGRLGSVIERNATSTYTTTYDWTAHDRLATTTDALLNIRRFQYDGLGNRIKAEDLHAPADVTFGVWTYQYDSASNLATTTDPKSQVVVRTYDALNRQTAENFTGLTGTEFTFAYDSCTNGKGKVCSITSATSTTAYTYHGSGAERTMARTIASTTYTSTTTYDYQLNPKVITYPNGSEAQYVYDTAGKLTRIDNRGQGGSFTPYVTDIDYGPHGLVTYEEHSNGVYTANTYDAQELYRLKRKHTDRLGTGGNPELTSEEENAAALEVLGSGASLPAISDPLIEDLISTIHDALTGSSSGSTGTSTPEVVVSDDEGVVEEMPVIQELSQEGEIKQSLPIPKASRERKPIVFSDGLDANGNQKKRVRIFADSHTAPNTKLEVTSDEQKIDAVHGASSVRFEKDSTKPLFSFLGADNQPIAVAASESVYSTSTILSREITNEGNGHFRIVDAVSGGNDVEIEVGAETIVKQVILSNEPSGEGENYDVSFLLSRTSGLELKYGDELLSDVGTITTNEAVTILSGGREVAHIHPPRATDETSNEHQIPYINIDVTYEYKEGSILATKHIPRSWLEKASYPVRADLTFSTRGTSGDGTLNGADESSNWDVLHDSTSGVNIDYSTFELNALTRNRSGYYALYRSFLVFDTSAIPDTATITGATTSVKIMARHDDVNDAYSYVGLYQGAQTNAYNIIASDIDKCGSVDNPSAGASLVDVGSTTVDTFLQFPLNATGTSWVSKSGYTKLCLREGHDVADVPTPGPIMWTYSGIRAYSADSVGTSSDPYIEISYTEYTPIAPLAPTSLQTEGQTNPTNLTTHAPNFTAVYTDTNSSDSATAWNVQVSASSTSWSSLVWDSGTTTFAVPVGSGSTTSNMQYNGTTTLANGTTYYWRVKLLDSESMWSPWSTSTASFVATSTASSTASAVQDLLYKYDSVGNITSIADARATTSPVTVYQYDDIYRLTSVGTTTGTRTFSGSTPVVTFTTPAPYRQWVYNALGNITYATNKGTYTYAGTGNANPHAPTQIGTTTLSYDNNGNLSSAGTKFYAWNYRNELILASTGAGASTTYAYDAGGSRLTKRTGTAATSTYPSNLYSTDGTAKTEYIFGVGELLGTIETGGGSGSATNTGYKTAGTVEVNTGWVTFSTTTINSSDNSYAVCDALCDNTDDAQTSDYNFGVPAGATINGIEVSIEAKEGLDSSNIPLPVSLSWNDGSSFTSTKTATIDGTTDATYTLGSSTDTWGRSWSVSEFADGIFRARFDKTAGTDTLSIDQLRIRIYYTNSGSSATSTDHIHRDHLAGTNAVTNASGTVTQTITYHPYGDELTVTGSASNDRHYIGQRYDTDQDLNYLNARYYNSSQGQFLSQDPVFWGDQNLHNPQSQNSYSYAENNPVNGKDPTGLALSKKEKKKLELKVKVLTLRVKLINLQNKALDKAIVGVTSFDDPVKGAKIVVDKKSSIPTKVIALVGVGSSVAGGGAERQGVKAIWSGGKSAVKNAFRHYRDHGADFNANNAVDYVQKARSFLSDPPSGTQVIVRSNGEKVLLHNESATFAVTTPDGTPKTFFKADPAIHGLPTNQDYFNAQQW